LDRYRWHHARSGTAARKEHRKISAKRTKKRTYSVLFDCASTAFCTPALGLGRVSGGALKRGNTASGRVTILSTQWKGGKVTGAVPVLGLWRLAHGKSKVGGAVLSLATGGGLRVWDSHGTYSVEA
jgi:hypothetical protein